MWKCPACDTNNELDQPCCVVCGALQSEVLRTQEKQDNRERVIDTAGSPGVDLRYNLTISLEEAVFGARKQIDFIREVACTACGGSGSEMVVCSTCKGTGQDRASNRDFSKESPKPAVLCKSCYGSGKVPVTQCSACHGLGRSSEHESKTVSVPPGINTGQAILFKGMGDVSYSNGANGNLYVSISISPHDKYTRDGFDLYADLPVSVSVVASGGEVFYETLYDTVKFRIPQGIDNGHLIRLRQQGVPQLNSSGIGDLLLRVRIT